MQNFKVWAPLAGKVDLYIDGREAPLAMTQVGEYWRAEVSATKPGTRYKYSVDGSDPMPDPQTQYQPDGVHGWSEVVEHSEFDWTDSAWAGVELSTSVLYELHIGTFTPEGTFDAAINKLDYLVDLGVSAIEIMPVAEFPGERGWGYDGVDLFSPHHAYGGPQGLKRLINACHTKGLGVILDVVYNHLGPDGAYLAQFAPYFTDKHQTPWGDAVNYDGEYSHGVREFVINNVTMWLAQYHCDALRLDAVHALVDDSKPHIVAEIAIRAERIGDARGWPAWIIAESDLNDPVVVESVEDNGRGASAQWSDDFHHALHAALTGEQWGYYQDFGDLDLVAKALNENFVYSGDYSQFRDAPRGKSAAYLPGAKFIGYLQNHDQIGNRAEGDRISDLIDHRLLYVGAAFTLLGPFVPMVFQGEEWATSAPFAYFTDHQDSDLAESIRVGRRREFADALADGEHVPDPQALETFISSKLNWDELADAEHARVHHWYRVLIALRHERSAFTGEACDASVEGSVLIMKRGDFVVVGNFSAETQLVKISNGELALQSGDFTFADGALTLATYAVAIFRSYGFSGE